MKKQRAAGILPAEEIYDIKFAPRFWLNALVCRLEAGSTLASHFVCFSHPLAVRCEATKLRA